MNKLFRLKWWKAIPTLVVIAVMVLVSCGGPPATTGVAEVDGGVTCEDVGAGAFSGDLCRRVYPSSICHWFSGNPNESLSCVPR